VSEQAAHVFELALAAEERRRQHWKVRGPVLERPERGKIVLETPDQELKQVLRPIQVLEPVLTEVADIDPIRWASVEQEGTRRLREEDLTAMTSRADSRCTVNIQPDVARCHQSRLSSVDADTYARLHAGRPLMAGERALDRDGRFHSVLRSQEDGERRVTLRVDVVTACLGKRGLDHSTLLGQDIAVAVTEPIGQPSRTLNVREEEGDRARRKARHAG
jgi:hypothetical protein